MSEMILVVGGTGFIGVNLVKRLLKEGYKVSVLSLNIPTEENKINEVNYWQADIANFEELQNRLLATSFDYVINLSGYVDHSKFMEGGKKIIDTHFKGVQNLLQLLDWTMIKRFVQIGSSDEYGSMPPPQSEIMRENPISSYSLGKVASTQLLQMLFKTEGLPAVILRPFLIYGDGQNNKRFLPQIINGCLKGVQFPVSNGEQLRDFCYVDDIIKGIILTLKNDRVNGEVINLASGKPISIRKVIELVQEVVGQGVPDFGAVPYRVGESMALYADVAKAKKLLGWEPSVSIDEGISRTVHYYQRKIKC